MILSNFFGNVLWLIYALIDKDFPVLFNSLCALTINFILISLKFKYK
ncbi:MAG: hypothetical protein KME30_04500 [Iphinoe sp. HA4291-MV1]|nr:hypothetical protein [Iphinoe sp. HA4291-MV1]